MIKITSIKINLKQLNGLYNKAPSAKHELYYAKLSILELCGWVEESMDDIVRRCMKKHLHESNNIKEVEGFIKRNSAFQYEANFRKMLLLIIGLMNLERLEKAYLPANFIPFEAALSSLKDPRNSQAHTHISGVTLTIDAPSVTARKFKDILNGFREIENKMKLLKLV